MRNVYSWRKRLLSALLALGLFLGAMDFSAITAQAADTEQTVITLNALGGMIASAVQGDTPTHTAWTQAGTGIYKRTLNSFLKLPNAIPPCYCDTIRFEGWYDSMEYTNKVEDVFVEGGSQTLYAKYVYLNTINENGAMWFQYTPTMADVRGGTVNQPIKTTFANNGYEYFYKIGSPVSQVESNLSNIKLSLPPKIGQSAFHKVNAAYDIFISSLVTLDGTYATLHYVVTNTGDTDVENFSLAYAADVMIGHDDGAIANTIVDIEKGCTYVQMNERERTQTNNDGTTTKIPGKVFRLYVKGSSFGITDVDRLWIGKYSGGQYRNNAFNYNEKPTASTGYDSALACSWVNRTIPANSSTILSVKLGVGDLSEMENANNTVTLDANGGAFRDGSEIVQHSGNSIPIASLEVPTRIGYKFDGWYLEREGGVRQTANITESITLYAHWKEALYALENATVVQSDIDNAEVPKETADIVLHYEDKNIGRKQSLQELLHARQDLSFSMDITDGYHLPESIFIDIRGVENTIRLTEGTGYEYRLNEDKTKAEITVFPEYVTGDVIVSTIGHPLPAECPDIINAIVGGGRESAEIPLKYDVPPVLRAMVTPRRIPNHTYHYQWYETSAPSNQGGGKIPKATEAFYAFPQKRALGTYYFYCAVTSERDNGQTACKISNVVKVEVKKDARIVTLMDKEETVTGAPISIGEAIVVPDIDDHSLITYSYYLDEACTRPTTPDSPEQGGTGALTEGGAPSAIGTYYVKAYVPNDAEHEASENTTAAKLTILPTRHKVTIQVNLDGKEWENHGKTFCLLNDAGTAVTDLDLVPSGTYRIFDTTDKKTSEDIENMPQTDPSAYGTDTGVTLSVDEKDTAATVNYYTVTFYDNANAYDASTPQKPQAVLSGQAARQPKDPVPRPGYVFNGWTAQQNSGIPFDFSAPIKQPTNLYATWAYTDLSYKIEHYLQNSRGGYMLADIDAMAGTIAEQVEALPKEYEGYMEEEDNPNRIPSGFVTADGLLTLKLYYKPIEYTIAYDLDGGSLREGEENPNAYTLLSDDISLIPPKKPGYAFLGWTQEESEPPQQEVTIPSGSMGNRRYVANWALANLPYQVEHYLPTKDGDYALRDTERLEGKVGEEKTAAPKQYEGYAEDLENQKNILNGTVAADGSLCLKLHYRPIEYRISYELDEGFLPEGTEIPTTYSIISDRISLPRPEKTGYVFTGWKASENGAPQKDAAIPSGSTGDKSFTAAWAKRTDIAYFVEHYQENLTGTGYTLKEQEELKGTTGETVTAIPKNYEGFTEDTGNPLRLESGDITVQSPLTLKLYYNRNQYAIRFVVDASKAAVTGETVQTLLHGQEIKPPIVTPNKGYLLNPLHGGWDADVPITAKQNATFTAQLSEAPPSKDHVQAPIITKPLEKAEETILKTNTDVKDPKGSKMYPLMLQAFGKNKSIRLKWRKINDADGYVLYGSRCGVRMERIQMFANRKTTSYTLKRLKKGVYYKYIVVAYKEMNGKKRAIMSSKSAHAVTNGGNNGNPMKVSCKPARLKLKKGKTKNLKPSYKEKKKVRVHIAKFRFYSDNEKIASVTGKGKVKAKSPGSCYIYVYAQNGCYKKVKVNVTK